MQAIWPGVHVLALAGLALRVFSAGYSHRINWPDEIFQYLEQAHRLVYGYGIVPWEYRYGVRNWLLPEVLGLILRGLRLVGLDEPATYIPAVGAIACVLSASLIYSLYAIARTHYDEPTARIASVLAAFWYELIFWAPIATPETLATYLLFGALALLGGTSSGRVPVIGLMLGLALALRLQYAPVVLLIAVLCWRQVHERGWLIAGLLTPIAAAGALDWYTWGIPFVSYHLALAYSAAGVADVFGVRSPAYYFWALTVASCGLHVLAGLLALRRWRSNALLLALVALVLIPHSLLGHKEYRFILAALPAMLVLLARALAGVWATAPGRSETGQSAARRAPLRRLGAGVVLATASTAGFLYLLPRQQAAYPHGALHRDPLLMALLDLSRRPQLQAVLDLTGHWTASGGFYYLHRDVPMFWKEHLGTREPGAVASHVVVRDPAPLPDGFDVLVRIGPVQVGRNRAGTPDAGPAETDAGVRAPRDPEVEARIGQPTVFRRAAR